MRLPRGLFEGLQKLRTRWQYRETRPHAVVHTMARVGSVSVIRALLERLPDHHFFHTHYLHPDSIGRAYEGFSRVYRISGRVGLYREYLAARFLRQRLDEGRAGGWRIVTLVRDPVARNVSAFFRHLYFNHPDLPAGFREDPSNVDRLVEMFRDPDEPERDVPLTWFDDEVRDVFGVDVLSEPFPRDGGGRTFSCDAGELLLLRVEDLSEHGPAALGRLFGVGPIAVRSQNRSEEQPYAETYRRFVARARVGEAYLDRIYSSKLARRFYTEEERSRFRARWRRDC